MDASKVTRETFWNVSDSGEYIFYGLAILATVVFIYGVVLQFRRIARGKKVDFREVLTPANVISGIRTVLANKRIYRGDVFTGFMHLMIMSGFIVLLIGTCIVLLEYDLFQKILGRTQGFWYGPFFLGFEIATDLFGIIFVLGLIIAIVRRYIFRPRQLNIYLIDLVLPGWLLIIAVTGYVIEGLRLAATQTELAYSANWSPGGHFFARFFSNQSVESLQNMHLGLWWFHGAIALVWLAYLPFAPKAVHILSAGINVLFRHLRSQGRLEKLDVEAAFENEETLGIQKISDLNQKDLLDLQSCTECGLCEMNCPASNAGRTLSPRSIVLGLQGRLKREQPFFGKGEAAKPILGNAFTVEDIWSCTTCKACVDACPVYIDPLSKILEARRGEVMMEDKFPDAYADLFSTVEMRGNPWNQHPSSRMDWAKGIEVRTMSEVRDGGDEVDYLFWVGCAASYDPRNQKIARALVQIMNHCEISFAVLGEEEKCTGDFLRRIGNEYMFQMQAEANVKILNNYSFKEILTVCPHCMNSLSNEHAEFGGNYKVIHHSELLSSLLDQKRIHPVKLNDARITFHDPCYLGRYNEIYDAPRNTLKAIASSELVEMKKSKSKSACCGAGGGRMWVDDAPDQRINDLRVGEAVETLVGSPTASKGGDGIIATSCPFCMTMIQDALGATETRVTNKDIAELLAEAMGLPI